MRRILLAILALGFVVTAQAAPESGLDRIRAFMHGIKTLKADFSQSVLDAQLSVTQESSGTFWLARPDRFRWDYAAPNAQIIVSDGANMWLYDPELEQVTVKPLDKTLASSPAMLLSGKESIEQGFNVKDVGEQGALYWVTLTPKVKDTDFETVRLAFKGEELQLMELKDKLGQTTRIRFSNIEHNPEIPDAKFQFTPPEGADVIGKPVSADSGAP